MKQHLSTILKMANSRKYNDKESKEIHEAIAWVNGLVAENAKLWKGVQFYAEFKHRYGDWEEMEVESSFTFHGSPMSKRGDPYNGTITTKEVIKKGGKLAREIAKEVNEKKDV